MDYFAMAHLVSDFSQKYDAVENDDGTITLKPRILPAGKLDSDGSTFKMDGDNSPMGYDDVILEVAQDLHRSDIENAWKIKPKKKSTSSTVKKDGVENVVSCYVDSMENAWSR